MAGFVRGEVVVLEFPFYHLKQTKRRPVLILKVPKGEDLIVLQITGSSYQKDVEILLEKKDFKKGSLKQDSYLRIDKVASIEKSLIKYKIGPLTRIKFEEIINKFCNFIKV